MIHDKDYIIRIVKQFSEMLATLLLGKNESELIEQHRIFETNMHDTFKMSFEDLSSQATDEILEWVYLKDTSHQIPYFELLGHLFYAKGKLAGNKNHLAKSKVFYELYLQKSGIFSMPIMARISEMDKEK